MQRKYKKITIFDQYLGMIPDRTIVTMEGEQETAPKLSNGISVEFYLYPTVGTVLIHSIKPELTEQDVIEYGGRSN